MCLTASISSAEDGDSNETTGADKIKSQNEIKKKFTGSQRVRKP
jgi:hypothetical protein